MPNPVVLPFAHAGDRVWVQMRAWETPYGVPETPIRFWGASAIISLIVSNTPTPLTGLNSFHLKPASVPLLRISRQGEQLVLRWSAGDETLFYDVEVASTLGAWRSSGMSPVLNRYQSGWGWTADWVLTNAPSGSGTFYRLRLLNP